MTVPAYVAPVSRKPREGWLGPHFWYDTIRLARKGWPILARVVFLSIVLISMIIMNRTQGDTFHYSNRAEFAWRADNFATLLILLQSFLILAILPVYLATSIVEEWENQTLEALSLTHLSDRELVLGKFGARLLHIGAFALVNVPLLAFMHLWGNVDAGKLIYHEVHLFFLLLSAGSLCMWVSAHSESVFQAINLSYILLGAAGIPSLAVAFQLPWMFTIVGPRPPEPRYALSLLLLAVPHFLIMWLCLRSTIARMQVLVQQQKRLPRKMSGALTLADNRPVSKKIGKRGQTQSRINPLAWPVSDNALHWKECLKDGTTYSLSARWLIVGIVAVAVASGLFRLLHTLRPPLEGGLGILVMALALTLSSYIIALVTYTMVIVFQMTMSVAMEREQKTLIFLLTVPVERREIFYAKWLGPWWRNWPILAVCNLGVALGFGSGLYGVKGALAMALWPWPFLLLLGAAAFWLSIVCRRVLLANIAIVGLLGLLLIAHIVWGEPAWHALMYHLALVSNTSVKYWSTSADESEAAFFAVVQQAIFLAAAGVFFAHSYWMFRRKDYSAG